MVTRILQRVTSHSRPVVSAVVVGAGPAGMMAAEVLAHAGCSVTLVDHMPSPGRKLLLAGRSGLNLTNAEPIERFLLRYGAAASTLQPALRAFDANALRAWAASLGEDTYIGTSGRVFPDAWRATPLLRAWLQRLSGLGVVLQTRWRFTGWPPSVNGPVDPRRIRVDTPEGTDILETDAVVLALGGGSWPRVGSDGGWVPLLRDAGVTVADLRPANAALERPWSSTFRERFEGMPLKNITITHAGVSVRGEVMITKRGIEGLPAYSHTATVRNEIAASGAALIAFDLHPDLTTHQVEQRLAKRRPRDSWSNGVRRSLGLAPAAISLLREATNNQPPSEPGELAVLVKSLPLRIESVGGIERAISSSGGVLLSEIDEHFMLRALPGVFVAGEMLDWEAPTGGYLLQAVFATGAAAAQGALRWATMAP